MLNKKLIIAALAAVTALACGSESTTDAGPADTGPSVDAGSMDAGEPEDAGRADAGPADAGPADAGPADAGPADAGPADAGPADAGPADAGPADAGPADAGPADAGPADAGATDAGATECTMGTEEAVGQLCVVDASTVGGEVTFRVVPMGCRSSSCTIQHTTTCSALRSGSNFDLSALFCLEPTGDFICTSDCGGGGFASCSVGGVEAGSYTATLGTLSVSFTVPSTLGIEGTCDGEPF